MDPIITRGLMACTCSQGDPKRSSTPGPKFSIRISLFFSSSTKTALPSGDFMLIVIERLLQFSMVKYRLSAFGTSRNWPRVASPPGDSSLITSAPIHASSCEHVGPACTCVMSRMRTPFSAFMLLSPGFLFFLGGARVQARDAPALRARRLVDHRVDERRLLRAEGLFDRAAQLRGGGRIRTHAAERL